MLNACRTRLSKEQDTAPAPWHPLLPATRQELLLRPNVSVAEAGRMCGFSDQFHFSRQFRAACGKSPLQYRKSILRAMSQTQ